MWWMAEVVTLAKIEKRLRQLESRCRVKVSPLSAESEKVFTRILDAADRLGGVHGLLLRIEAGEDTELDRATLADLPMWQGTPPMEVFRLVAEVDNAI